MYNTLFLFILAILPLSLFSQKVMTAEDLIELNRVSGISLINDNKDILYAVSKVNIKENKKYTRYFQVSLNGENKKEIFNVDQLIKNKETSPDGIYEILVEDVKIRDVSGVDFYPEMTQSNMMVYNSLNYRHWDTWEDGKYNHIIIENKKSRTKLDIMANEPFDCPQKPFGGSEDYTWSPDGKCVLYVSKKLFGTEYAVSTNTDIFCYNIETSQTINITEENKGYDTHPVFSSKGTLAYLQMKRDGYESDKNDIVIQLDNQKLNLTSSWDGTVNEFHWSNDGSKIYFVAPIGGTVQLFELNVPKSAKKFDSTTSLPKQITNGQFDIRGIIGHNGNTLIASRGDMNHASELYSVDLSTGEMNQLTHENDELYNSISLSKIEKRVTKTVDGKDMLSWVIYPPNFDPNKKYPTLLYCQGGPQGALSQFYSFRWNFQLMAAQGYIVIAPNRRGMPGYGVEWNEQISKDYGGLNMQDYLAAIDDLSTESFVDKNRLGCVGASYGGYSAFYLAAIHEGRFKSFIAHDGIFNWKSMYGTTEELFFVNWDLGGAYWDKENKVAQKSHTVFNPAERVQDWTAPIMVIQGGLDFRVPIGQGLEAFQAAQLQGIKSRLLYFPEENHWVLDYQNSLIWHSEFAKWLSETL
jgi:dipeptidyl aminopeptidase/acylaminoacyl peptidase